MSEETENPTGRLELMRGAAYETLRRAMAGDEISAQAMKAATTTLDSLGLIGRARKPDNDLHFIVDLGGSE